MTAEEVMTPQPVSVKEEASADELMKTLEEHHFIRVPVVDEQGKVVGVVSRTDILKGYVQSETGDIPWWM